MSDRCKDCLRPITFPNVRCELCEDAFIGDPDFDDLGDRAIDDKGEEEND